MRQIVHKVQAGLLVGKAVKGFRHCDVPVTGGVAVKEAEGLNVDALLVGHGQTVAAAAALPRIPVVGQVAAVPEHDKADAVGGPVQDDPLEGELLEGLLRLHQDDGHLLDGDRVRDGHFARHGHVAMAGRWRSPRVIYIHWQTPVVCVNCNCKLYLELHFVIAAVH